nr:hypothetical protein [Hyphomonas sp. Mor2]
MNTVAHVIVACAALSRPDAPRRNLAVVAGALIPDASMFVFFAWSRLNGWSGDETWNVRYWMEPWQTLGAVSNSFVLFTALLALSVWRKWPVLTAAAIAALLHIALDFPLHADDAHRHFWPVSDWRFQSPVSYWDPAANGLIGNMIETATVLGATILLWRRFQGMKTRIALALLLALQVAALVAWLSWAG